MTAAQISTMAYLHAMHAELDARDLLGNGWIDTRLPTDSEMAAIAMPRQYRFEPAGTVWTQYRRWLLDGLRSGSFAVIAMGCFVLGMYAAVIMGMLK